MAKRNPPEGARYGLWQGDDMWRGTKLVLNRVRSSGTNVYILSRLVLATLKALQYNVCSIKVLYDNWFSSLASIVR